MKANHTSAWQHQQDTEASRRLRRLQERGLVARAEGELARLGHPAAALDACYWRRVRSLPTQGGS